MSDKNMDMIRAARDASDGPRLLSDAEALRVIADNVEGFWLGLAEAHAGVSTGLTSAAKYDASRLRAVADKLERVA